MSAIKSHAPFAVLETMNPIADRFVEDRQTAGSRLRYRLFRPDAYLNHRHDRTRYPLVLTLHGAGEAGVDNASQLEANQLATGFADPDWQKAHPAFVLSPQLVSAAVPAAWSDGSVEQSLLTLIYQIEAKYPVDERRVYISGVSLGALGAWDLMVAAPTTFAGALLDSYGGNPNTMDNLTHQPFWNIQSSDDDTVSYETSLRAASGLEGLGVRVTRAEYAGNLPLAQSEHAAQTQWDQAKSENSHALFTAYSPGTTGLPGQPVVGPHASWIDVFTNPVYREWLFRQCRDSK